MKSAQARLSPPTLGQVASEAALKTPQSYFAEVNAEYRERRNILVDGLNTIPEVVCPMPCLLYTSPSPRDRTRSRMPSSA